VIKYRSVSADDRVAEVLTWFDGSPKYFPNFGALYFDILDIAGHRFGPYHRMVFTDVLLEHLFDSVSRFNVTTLACVICSTMNQGRVASSY